MLVRGEVDESKAIGQRCYLMTSLALREWSAKLIDSERFQSIRYQIRLRWAGNGCSRGLELAPNKVTGLLDIIFQSLHSTEILISQLVSV